MSDQKQSSADRTRTLLAQMFPATAAAPTELARARTALDLALAERSRLRRARLFTQLPAARERVAACRAAVKRLASR